MKRNSTMTENWKKIVMDNVEYSTYEVSDHGRIRDCKKNIILVPIEGADGYLRCKLYKDGKTKTFLVHHLVAYAFLPKPENK